MSDYGKKLEDPRWQRLRVSILKAWGGGCMDCGNEDLPLQVHHTYYLKGREPWDYPYTAFKVLCPTCHRKAHAKQNLEDNFCDGEIRPVRTIKQAMLDMINGLIKKSKGNG